MWGPRSSTGPNRRSWRRSSRTRPRTTRPASRRRRESEGRWLCGCWRTPATSPRTSTSSTTTRPCPPSATSAAEWEPTNYFIEEVRRRLLDDPRLGITRQQRSEALFGGGLRVYTTYDPVVQEMAERAVADNLPEDERFFTAALASVEPGTGYVRAIVGGPGFDKFEFNIATQKGRPTGSSFKAFVLAAAMENGYVPSDQVNGIGSCVFSNPGGFPNPYIATNFGGSGGSVATIRSQTLRSSNCAYLRLGEIVGQSNVVDVARSVGITSDLDSVISLPLGPFDITPLDMATAYRDLHERRHRLRTDLHPPGRGSRRKRDPREHSHRHPGDLGSVGSAGHLGARGQRAGWDRHPGPGRGSARRRQDRHRSGLRRCLVRRLHALPLDRGVDGQPRRTGSHAQRGPASVA